jgi:hypothetical protein
LFARTADHVAACRPRWDDPLRPFTRIHRYVLPAVAA